MPDRRALRCVEGVSGRGAPARAEVVNDGINSRWARMLEISLASLYRKLGEA